MMDDDWIIGGDDHDFDGDVDTYDLWTEWDDLEYIESIGRRESPLELDYDDVTYEDVDLDEVDEETAGEDLEMESSFYDGTFSTRGSRHSQDDLELNEFDEETELDEDEEEEYQEECEEDYQEVVKAGKKHKRNIQSIERELSAVILQITAGKLIDLSFQARDDIMFPLCIQAQNRTYDTVLRHSMQMHGKLEKVEESMVRGEFPAKNLDELFMLVLPTYIIQHVLIKKYKYGKLTEDERKMAEINTPAVEFLCQYYTPAKLCNLLAEARGMNINIRETEVLYLADRMSYQYMNDARAKIKVIFEDLVQRGEVKIKWMDEKKLFTYASLGYPDAQFKFKQSWANDLFFDIFIPSLNVVIDYILQPNNEATELEKKKYTDELALIENKKKPLCQAKGITYLLWNGSMKITEENFKKFISQIDKK